MENWEARSLTLGWLRRKAYDHREMTDVFGWLKAIGVVPMDVTTRRVVPVKVDLNPSDIKAGYLASGAFEWDSWGASSPVDFMDAIEAETAGEERRDTIAALLTLLGRETMSLAA